LPLIAALRLWLHFNVRLNVKRERRHQRGEIKFNLTA